ncbi:hypothetical protein Tco_0994949 [Tanacetum coccineum]
MNGVVKDCQGGFWYFMGWGLVESDGFGVKEKGDSEDLEAELVKRKNMVERDVYTELSNSFAKLKNHCISLELDIQLNEHIFQKDKSCNNQNALEIPKYFENNDLKAQLQAKDTTIRKLKENIKSMRENHKEEKVKQNMNEIETINIELEHSVAKLLSKNELLHKEIEHLKKIYKDQFDLIKKTHALSKEYCESVIAQLNSKSMENADLKGMFKLDLDPLAPRFVKNRDAYIYYLKYTQEQADILRGIVEQAKAKQPLDNALDFVESSRTPDSNKPVLPFTRLKSFTSASRSRPTGNKKNDRISQTPSSNMKNKVEVQLRRANFSSNKKNHVKDPICDANAKHTILNVNS